MIYLWTRLRSQGNTNIMTDIEAAEEICIDFQHKTATYSEPEFRVNMFIADTSFPLARHIVGPQNTRTLTVLLVS